MVSNTPDQTAMAPTLEPTGDEKKMPSFDEVADLSRSPCFPASPLPASEDPFRHPDASADPLPRRSLRHTRDVQSSQVVNQGFIVPVSRCRRWKLADAASAQPIPETRLRRRR